MVDFRKIVRDKIAELGVVKAKGYFGVSAGTISNWSSGRNDPPLEALEKVLGDRDLEAFIPSNDIKPEPAEEVPPALETWEGKDVIMLQPLYRGFSSDTHFALFANYAKYGPEKIGMIMEKRTVIHESRNILTHKFLKTKSTYCIFTDDDMIPPCGSAELFASRFGTPLAPKLYGHNAISRLMSHPADKRIVGLLYFGRHAKGRAQCSSGFTSDNENAKLRNGEYTGLKQEEWVAPGFCRIHRSVFEELKAAIDGGKFPECKPKRDDLWYGYWNPVQVGVGEDVSFGRRCAELGIKSYVDTSCVALHIGETAFGAHNTK
jgi:transcriptional regulator with XRE-family HTH domain